MANIIHTTNHICAPVQPKAGFLHKLLNILAIHRQRRALKDLPEATLNDLGLTRDQALAEAARPAWDVPTHWVR